jgi:hypothetical protein
MLLIHSHIRNPATLNCVMRPNITNLLEENVSAKFPRDPQDMHDGNSVSGSKELMGPRRGQRAKKPHSMWREYAK